MDRYSIILGKIPSPQAQVSKEKKPKKEKKGRSPEDRWRILDPLLRTAEGRARIAAAMCKDRNFVFIEPYRMGLGIKAYGT